MKRTIITTIALLTVVFAGLARGVQQVSATFSNNVHVTTTAMTSGCYNAPGPKVILQGELAIG